MERNNKLTSTDILTELQRSFKSLAIMRDFSQQKLLNRAMHLYLTDVEFRNKIEAHLDLKTSGSQY